MSQAHFSEIKSGPGTRFSFDIKDVDLSIVNAIRRVILAEIPNVAIAFDPYDDNLNDILFGENTSSLHNEFMGHRISLIPINLTLKEIHDWDPASYKFQIKLKNETIEKLLVTSKQIAVLDGSGDSVPDKLRDRFFPPDAITGDYLLITKLKPNPFNKNEGEVLECEMQARKGTAKQHARWSHVSLCSFINMVDEKAADAAYKELVKGIDPTLTDEEKNRILNRFTTLDRLRIYYKNEYGEPSQFRFSLECINNMIVPHELVTTAFDILIEKVESLADAEKSEIHCLNASDHMFMVKVKDEGHTIGNMMQSLIYNGHMRETEVLKYVGYYQPHPLENDVVLKIRHEGVETVEQMREFFAEASKRIAGDLIALRKEWMGATGTKNATKPTRSKKIK